MMMDLEGYTYARQEQGGLLLGVYELTPEALEPRRRPVGLRPRAHPRGRRPDRPGARRRLRALPVPGRRGDPALGQRRLHLHPGRQPARRAGPRAARATGSPAASWPGFSQGGGVGLALAQWMVRRRAGRRRLRHGRRAVRRVRERPRLPRGDDGAVLQAALRHDLPQRAAAGGPPAAGRRRSTPTSRPRAPAGVSRGAWRRRSTSRPTTRASPRPRPCGAATPSSTSPAEVTRHPRGRRHPRHDGVLPLRGPRTRGRGPGSSSLRGVEDPGARRHPARADAQPVGPAARRPHADLLGGRRVLADGLVLPARSGTCAGSSPSSRAPAATRAARHRPAASPSATSPTTSPASRSPARPRATCSPR